MWTLKFVCLYFILSYSNFIFYFISGKRKKIKKKRNEGKRKKKTKKEKKSEKIKKIRRRWTQLTLLTQSPQKRHSRPSPPDRVALAPYHDPRPTSFLLSPPHLISNPSHLHLQYPSEKLLHHLSLQTRPSSATVPNRRPYHHSLSSFCARRNSHCPLHASSSATRAFIDLLGKRAHGSSSALPINTAAWKKKKRGRKHFRSYVLGGRKSLPLFYLCARMVPVLPRGSWWFVRTPKNDCCI